MENIATYIRLTEQFGGLQFGPYEDLEVRMGSDRESCHIFIPENFGVLDVHAKIQHNSPTDVILSPVQQSAEVFLWRKGTRKPI